MPGSTMNSSLPAWKSPTLDISGWGVLVTGATSGIGEACAWQFVEQGCKVAILGRRTERLTKLKEDMCKYFNRNEDDIVCITQDVSKIDELQQLEKKIPFNVDILVNNAGLALGAEPVDQIKIDDVEKMLTCNVLALVAITRLFVPGMKERGLGHVINISSVAGTQEYEGGTGYNASKFAVHGFTKAMRMDLAGTPIRVTSVSPGAVETEFSVVRFSGDKNRAESVYKDLVPLNASDVADNVVYASTRPRHVQVCDLQVFCTNQGDAKYTVKRVGDNFPDYHKN